MKTGASGRFYIDVIRRWVHEIFMSDLSWKGRSTLTVHKGKDKFITVLQIHVRCALASNKVNVSCTTVLLSLFSQFFRLFSCFSVFFFDTRDGRRRHLCAYWRAVHRAPSSRHRIQLRPLLLPHTSASEAAQKAPQGATRGGGASQESGRGRSGAQSRSGSPGGGRDGGWRASGKPISHREESHKRGRHIDRESDEQAAPDQW